MLSAAMASLAMVVMEEEKLNRARERAERVVGSVGAATGGRGKAPAPAWPAMLAGRSSTAATAGRRRAAPLGLAVTAATTAATATPATTAATSVVATAVAAAALP